MYPAVRQHTRGNRVVHWQCHWPAVPACSASLQGAAASRGRSRALPQATPFATNDEYIEQLETLFLLKHHVFEAQATLTGQLTGEGAHSMDQRHAAALAFDCVYESLCNLHKLLYATGTACMTRPMPQT